MKKCYSEWLESAPSILETWVHIQAQAIIIFIYLSIYTIYSTGHKQHYGLHLRKFVHCNLPQVGSELGSLGSQAGMLPIELPLLVIEKTVYLKSYLSHVQLWSISEKYFIGIFVWVVNSFSFEWNRNKIKELPNVFHSMLKPIKC